MEFWCSVSDFHRMCRACLGIKSSRYLISLEEPETFDMYTKYTALEVSAEDGLPHQICTSCVNHCETGRAFQDKCSSNETILLLALSTEAQSTESIKDDKELPINYEQSADMNNGLIVDEHDHQMIEEIESNIETEEDVSGGVGDEVEEVVEDEIEEGVEEEVEEEYNDEIYEMKEEFDYSENEDELETAEVIKTTSRNHKIKCQYCDVLLKDSDSFEEHINKEHKDEKVHACKDCDSKYQSMFHFRNHMYSHSAYLRKPGSIAKTRTRERFKLRAVPVRTESGVSNIKCQYCEQVYQDISQFESHLKTHSKETTFNCKDCDATFSRRTRFKYHMFKHADFEFPCKKCDSRFSDPELYMRHKMICINPYMCEFCGTAWPDQRSLSNHVISHSNVRAYECDICFSKLKTEQSLIDHKRRHTGDKRFICKLCDKSFYFNSDLNEHNRRVHSDVRPHVCSVCGKGYLKACLLTDHMRSHTGERPFHCDECPAKFRKAHKLREHKTIHTGEKPYSCKICGKCFRMDWTLRVHLKSHNKS